MPDRVELLVNGTLYGGWLDVAVTRAMDAMAGAFNLSVTERWQGQEIPWPIRPGDGCEVRIGGETFITGYVDIVKPSFAATSHTIQVQGRDKSGDLIDCSAVHEPDQWSNIDLLALANRLGQPFGVSARAEIDVGPKFGLVKLEQGETAFEAIERHARMRRCLVCADGLGGILITRAGRRRAAVRLEQGQNILSASGTLDYSQRFSDYIVKGQASFSDTTDGEAEAHVRGSATDPRVSRYRPMLIISESDPTRASAKDRAVWEASTRIGKSASARITVQGWRQEPEGDLWQPNMLVHVQSDWLRMNGEMLIRQVTFRRGNSGTVTELDVVSPQAYAPEPPVAGKADGMGGEGSLWREALDG